MDVVDGENSIILSFKGYTRQLVHIFCAVALLIVTNWHRGEVETCCCNGCSHGGPDLGRFQTTAVQYM